MAGTWKFTIYLPIICIFLISLLSGFVLGAKEMSELIEINSGEHLETLIKKPAVTLVYFYKKGLPGLNSFLKEYTRSAQHLREFNLNFAIADCTKFIDVHYCTDDYTEYNVYGFREGQQKISLPLETVFDLNSIVASALHLSMAAYLPITQTVTEREQVEKRCKESCNIVFGYQLALGTYDHRVFMEVAYSFSGQLMFALTTNTPVTRGLVSELKSEDLLSHPTINSAIWVIFCQEVKSDENCSNIRYRGSMDTPSVATFLNNLALPKWIDLSTDGKSYQNMIEINKNFLYLVYDAATKDVIIRKAQELGDIFYGSLSVIIVPVEKVPIKVLLQVHSITSKSLAHIFCQGSGINLRCEVLDELENTTDYIMRKLFDFSEVNSLSNTNNSSEELIEEECCCEDLLQDDGVLMGLQRDRRKPTFKMIKAITEATFSETLLKKDIFAITFYVPWDPVCQAFFLSLDQATESLPPNTESLVFRTNCADWPILCDKNNITSYPTIKIFRKNKDTLNYVGLLGGNEFLTTIFLYASDNPVIFKSSEEVNSFVRGKWSYIPNKPLFVTIVGFFTVVHQKEIEAFKEAAAILHGQFSFGTFENDTLVTEVAQKFEVSLPTVVIFKRNDKHQPYVLFNDDYNSDKIVKFVENSYLPVFPELSAFNFISYLKKQKPFVILFDLMFKHSHLWKELGKLAAEQKFPEVIFCWLPVDSSRNVGTSILFNYTKDLVVPAITILDKVKGNIYNYVNKRPTIEDITIWIQNFLQGSLKASEKLVKEEWKPVNPGIDFLSLMDEDNSKKSHISEAAKDDSLESGPYQNLQDFQNGRLWQHYKQSTLKHQTKEKMQPESKVNVPHFEHTEL